MSLLDIPIEMRLMILRELIFPDSAKEAGIAPSRPRECKIMQTRFQSRNHSHSFASRGIHDRSLPVKLACRALYNEACYIIHREHTFIIEVGRNSFLPVLRFSYMNPFVVSRKQFPSRPAVATRKPSSKLSSPSPLGVTQPSEVRLDIIEDMYNKNTETVCAYARNLHKHIHCEVLNVFLTVEPRPTNDPWYSAASGKRRLDLDISRLQAVLKRCADEVHLSVHIEEAEDI